MDYGLIVDLETTGLSAEEDQIIEIGLLEFCVEDGEPPAIVTMYSATEEPTRPITDEITKITGITQKQVAGRRIDWATVGQFFERASIVIAHNAAFERSFLDRRPELAHLRHKHWACSMNHIDWTKHGFGTRSLNYLAADHGFVNAFAHRALFDCATTYRLVTPYLPELIARSYEKEIRIHATGSPFDSKDKLKARGYRWDGAVKCWSRTVTSGELAEERLFLEKEVYRGASWHDEEHLSPSSSLPPGPA